MGVGFIGCRGNMSDCKHGTFKLVDDERKEYNELIDTESRGVFMEF